jgi:hypothetical protein
VTALTWFRRCPTPKRPGEKARLAALKENSYGSELCERA